MKFAILGASGTIGSRIVGEASSRGHIVTAVARVPPGVTGRTSSASADATNAAELERVLIGQEAVVSAVGPARGSPPAVLLDVTRALAAAAMRTGVRRVLIVGGAGSLAVKPGLELLATPDFPETWRDVALAHREALELWRRVKELDWTYVSPAANVVPGTRTGRFRTGHDDLLVDEGGQSRISAEDLAVGILETLENGAHVRERITFAY